MSATIQLYQFTHCPYCIRVAMTLGYLNIPYESKITPYDDVETPIKLIGQKKLPALKFADGRALGESLDIIRALDQNGELFGRMTQADMDSMGGFLSKLSTVLHPLAIPEWIKFPEFNEQSKAYFLNKQLAKRGTLADMLGKKAELVAQFNDFMPQIEAMVSAIEDRAQLSILDIMLAAHLWPLQLIAKDVKPSEKVENYLKKIAYLCHFDYLQHIKQM